MITEVAPAPKMFLFMSLFNTVGVRPFPLLRVDTNTQETSSFIGPFVTSAIVDAAGGNTYVAFYFLLPLGLIALGVVCCISPAKAKIDVARCKSIYLLVLMIDLEKEARNLYGRQERPSEKELEVVQEVRQ
jgi:hypothetical protein